MSLTEKNDRSTRASRKDKDLQQLMKMLDGFGRDTTITTPVRGAFLKRAKKQGMSPEWVTRMLDERNIVEVPTRRHAMLLSTANVSAAVA